LRTLGILAGIVRTHCHCESTSTAITISQGCTFWNSNNCA
jgi:hypothetical protein